jgi:hypothetical protein
MANLERLEFLTQKLHDLLSQAQEIKRLIQERQLESQESASITSDDGPPAEEDLPPVEQKEPRSYCCFSRKRKLN